MFQHIYPQWQTVIKNMDDGKLHMDKCKYNNLVDAIHCIKTASKLTPPLLSTMSIAEMKSKFHVLTEESHVAPSLHQGDATKIRAIECSDAGDDDEWGRILVLLDSGRKWYFDTWTFADIVLEEIGDALPQLWSDAVLTNTMWTMLETSIKMACADDWSACAVLFCKSKRLAARTRSSNVARLSMPLMFQYVTSSEACLAWFAPSQVQPDCRTFATSKPCPISVGA